MLEAFVLDLIRDRMMRPEAVTTFIAAYHQEINSGRDGAEADSALMRKALNAASRKLEGLYEAVADGLRTPGLLEQIAT